MADSYALFDRSPTNRAPKVHSTAAGARVHRLLNFAQIAGVLGGFDLNWPGARCFEHWLHRPDRPADRAMAFQAA